MIPLVHGTRDSALSERLPPAKLALHGEPPGSDSWIPEQFLTCSADLVRREAKFAVSVCPE